MENNNNSRPHLVYMTGLSVDKIRFNNITENINFDKDYRYWFSLIETLTSKATTDFQNL